MDKNTFSICFFAPSSILAGAERSLLDLMKQLVSQGIKCSVVMEGEDSFKNVCIKNGIIVKTVSSMSWWCTNDEEVDGCYQKILQTIKHDLSEIVSIVKTISPNLIYSQTVVNPFGAMVAESLSLPHLWGIREYGELDHGLKFVFDYKQSMQAMYQTSDAVFNVTESVAKVVLGKKYKNSNVKVNYSNVDIPDLYKNQKLSLFKDNNIKIGIFGSIAEGKNQKDAVEACLILLQENYPIELIIIGHKDERYYSELLKYINDTKYEDSFKFIEYTNEPIRMMNQMDIILSCAKSEALGRTLLEAILLKKPIIYANVAGPKEIYADGVHGLAYELYNIKNLADKITCTIRNKKETKQRVQKAYEYVSERFNATSYIEPLMKTIKQIDLKNKNRKRKYVTELVVNCTINYAGKKLNTLQKELQYKDELIQKKDHDIKQLEELFYNREQQLHEKSLQIISLQELAESMRIKNRIKKILGIKF